MLRQILASILAVSSIVAVCDGAIASFKPQPNNPPIGTGGTGTRYRELPPRRVDPTQNPRIAQSALSKRCSTKAQVETCRVYRINGDRSLTLLYTSVYNKRTGQVRVIPAPRSTQALSSWNSLVSSVKHGDIVSDENQCEGLVAVPTDDGIKCIDPDAEFSLISRRRQQICDRVDKRQCRGKIITSPRPLHDLPIDSLILATSDDSKSVPEQNPRDVYPGLPPAPPQPQEDQQVETAYRGSGRVEPSPEPEQKSAFKPNSRNGSPRVTVGSAARFHEA